MELASSGELWEPGHLLMSDVQVCASKRGSMGVVYFCKALGDSVVPFVIKTLPGALLVDNRELFLQEISTWIELGAHPHIVRAYQALEIEERLCLVLEYVAGDMRHGSDLGGWIGTPELDLKRALTFGWQICAGMRHALATFQRVGKTLIHRDLKPENLLVASPTQVKISDFGAAVLLDLAQARLPAGAEELGNRVYLSPEQCRGDLALDTRSDIYSFGCVLYEMLTGRTVFPIPRTSPDYIEAHLSEPPPDPQGVNAKIPAMVRDVVMRCLQKEPTRRFDGFAAVQDQLGRLHEELFSAPLREAAASRITGRTAALGDLMTKVTLGKTRAALEAVVVAGETDQGDASEPSVLDRTTALLTAEALAKEGRSNEGIEVLDRLIARQRDGSDLWNQRGRLLLNLGRPGDALASFDKALELAPRDPLMLNNKAYALLEMNRPREALLCLEACLTLNPRLAGAWNNQGRAHAGLEEWAEASASYKNAVACNPSEAEVWFNWSVADINLQRADLAKAHLRRSLAVDRLHWKALRNLCVIGHEVGHTEDDLAVIAGALEAQLDYAREHPRDLERLREVAITVLVVGRRAEGRELVERIVGARRDTQVSAPREGAGMSNNRADEAAVMIAALELMTAMVGGEECRVTIELPPDVDKHMVIFVGLWPLLCADAAQRGLAPLWLAPDGNSECRAANKARDFMIDAPRATFDTWDHCDGKALKECWIVGDLDWSDQPVGYNGDAVVNGIRRVLLAEKCPMMLVHQRGRASVIDVPPTPGH